MTDLEKAAQAVLGRWDSPAWEWMPQGPTAARMADLMADLRRALAAHREQAEPVAIPGAVPMSEIATRSRAMPERADALDAMEAEHIESLDSNSFAWRQILAAQIVARFAALAQQAEPVAWMVYTQDGRSVYVTDNPIDINPEQRALPLFTTPQQAEQNTFLTKPKEASAMENQHRQIKGYRELSQEEIDAMNEIKAKGAELGAMVERLRSQDGLDQRWISIGATDLQLGLMALTRGVAKPTTF
jgi:hypothetical protein